MQEIRRRLLWRKQSNQTPVVPPLSNETGLLLKGQKVMGLPI